jgi:hypothetical protein
VVSSIGSFAAAGRGGERRHVELVGEQGHRAVREDQGRIVFGFEVERRGREAYPHAFRHVPCLGRQHVVPAAALQPNAARQDRPAARAPRLPVLARKRRMEEGPGRRGS